jgi:hypothetical protein
MWFQPGYGQSPQRNQRPTHAPTASSAASSASRRLENVMVYLADPQVCPVSLPLRGEKGFASLRSGRPAKRFVADGFVVAGKTVSCLVAPDDRTGRPIVLWADGAPINRFRLVGG